MSKRHFKLWKRKQIIFSLLWVVLSSQACTFPAAAASTLEPVRSLPPTPVQEQPAIVLETPTVEVRTPTAMPVFAPPAGFKEYQDAQVPVSVYIPETWVITGIVEGQYAIFQSYPEDKYIGGEGRDPDDTKCDLNIRPLGESSSDLIQTWQSDPLTTILSEEEMVLQTGQPAIRMEMDSMGRANAMITEINGRVVVLTCFGNFAQFDEIAVTLGVVE